MIRCRVSEGVQFLAVMLSVLASLVAPGFAVSSALASGPVVTTAVDEDDGCAVGDCSLREAIAAAGAGSTITFSADYAITLSSELLIDKNLTIDGGTRVISISGNDAVRVFHVSTDTHVTFKHLTIAHGRTEYREYLDQPVGGGIKIESGAVVTLANSAVSGNIATYYDADWDDYYGLGGGIFNLGTLTVIGTTFSDNVAAASSGYGFGEGGAIFNLGMLRVTDCSFSDNAATAGAALINRSGATMNVEGSIFSGNSAPCGGGAVSNSGTATVGGSMIANNLSPGEWCDGGAAGIENNHGTMEVSRSMISENIGDYNTGGLSNYQGELTVTDSTIADNIGGKGGGIYNWWGATLTVTGCGIHNNASGSFGGGILNGPDQGARLTVVNSTITNNTAPQGGGIYNGYPGPYANAVLTLTNSTVVGNTADDNGGGICNANASPNVTNSILWNNTAPAGPQIYNSTTNIPGIRNSDIQGSGGSGLGWDAALGTDGGGNLDQSPVLGPLADNGGYTMTHALPSGSPAVDTADAAACPATDQRGVARPQGSGCDMGAFEEGPAEMEVLGLNDAVILNGDTTPMIGDGTNFGEALAGSEEITRSFTISNIGGAALNLTGTPLVTIAGAQAKDFSLVLFPTTPVAPVSATTFQIRFAPSGVGVRTATLTIGSNDDDENPYSFRIQGTGTDEPFDPALMAAIISAVHRAKKSQRVGLLEPSTRKNGSW